MQIAKLKLMAIFLLIQFNSHNYCLATTCIYMSHVGMLYAQLRISYTINKVLNHIA